MPTRWKSWLLNALMLAACLFVMNRTIRGLRPAYNWDMLGYMALALEWQVDDPVEVHRQTYAAAKAELPRAAYLALVTPQVPVRIGRFENPDAFQEHLAFYRARVTPTYLIHVMHRLGAPLSAATWWLSVGTYALTALLIVIWLAYRLPAWVALPVGTALAHAPPLLMTATLNTPDGLGTLLLFLGLFLFVERRRSIAGAAVLVLAITTRPDAVIVIGILAAALFLLERKSTPRLSLRFLGAWLAASAATYLAVQGYSGEYGWWPLFSISFLGKELYPSTLDKAPDIAAYGAELGRQIERIPSTGYFMAGRAVTGSAYVFVYAGFAAMALAVWRRIPQADRRQRVERHAAVLVALLASYAVRWLLFPQLWDRFFVLLYLLAPLLALSMVLEILDERADQKSSNETTASITSD